MKAKKFLALLCAVAVGLTLLVLPSSATGSLFFLSLNDTLPAQSVQTAPIQSSGWVYVPTGVFNSRTTGINFGVYYGLTDNNESLVLYNLSGNQTDYSYYYLPFTDVAPGAWYYNAVAWAYCNDVTSGTSATTFTPNAAITRQQLVTFLYRYTVKYAPEFTGNAAPISAFPDAGSVANWAYAAMSWAVGNGLIQGNAHDNGLDYLDPNGSATRAQTATIIMRYCQLIGA